MKYSKEFEEYAAQIAKLACARGISKIGAGAYSGRLPEALVEFLKESKVFYNLVSKENGGDDSLTKWLYALREVGAQCNTTVHIMTTQSLCVHAFRISGEDSDKKELYTEIITLEKQTCFCLTEPNGGTDAGNMQTVVAKRQDGYVLTGVKNMIMNAGFADYFLVAARLAEVPGYNGITLFLVPRKSEGLSVAPHDETLGVNGVPINTVTFKDVFVPRNCLVGKEGEGWKLCMKVLDRTRPGVAAAALGAARTALAMCIDYSSDRMVFGKPLIKYQTTTNKIAEMGIALESAWLMTERAGLNIDEGGSDIALTSCMAKITGTETAFQVANEALGLFGGYGYLKDHGIEKIFRDLRVGPIYDGTNEILKGITATELIKKYRPVPCR